MPRASLHARDAIACCPIAHGHAAGHVTCGHPTTFGNVRTAQPRRAEGPFAVLRSCVRRPRFSTRQVYYKSVLQTPTSTPAPIASRLPLFRGGMDRRTRATFTPARRLSAAWKRHRARPYWLAATSLAPQARACLLSCGRACLALLDHTQVLTLIFSTSQRAAQRAILPSHLVTLRTQKSWRIM